MGEPTRVGWHDLSIEEEHAEQERLLARIEDEDLISGWCWGPLAETVGKLRQVPDGVAWVATRYLQAVVVRGDTMFGAPEHYQQSMFEAQHRPGVECRCGATAEADRTMKRHGRDVTVAVCRECGITLAVFDGELYPHRTLLSRGFQ